MILEANHCCSITNSVLLLNFLKTFQNALLTRGKDAESTWFNGMGAGSPLRVGYQRDYWALLLFHSVNDITMFEWQP